MVLASWEKITEALCIALEIIQSIVPRSILLLHNELYFMF